MRIPLRAAGRVALATALALATATCTEQPTEPGTLRSAVVRFAPVFAANTFVAGLPIDNVTVTVAHLAGDTIAVKNFPFAVTDSVLDLSMPVMLQAPSESLVVSVDLQHGAGILFHGLDTVVVVAGAAGAPVPGVTMQYVGPGANVAYLSVLPRDTVLRFGDSLFFSATAADNFESAVNQFYLRWFTSPSGTPIRADGRIIAPNVRGTIMVHAWTPSGVQDSTTLTFVPVPTQILKVGGDLQSDTAGDTLTTAFLVQVKAADNLPVDGVPVTFAAVTSLGSVLTTSTVTDSLGHASAVGVLGDSAKVYSYTATVAGLAPVTFTAQANAGAPALIAIVSGNGQSDTAGKTLANPLVVQVADINHNPILGVPVIWTRLHGTGTPALDTVLSNGAGKSQLLWTLGGPGIDSIRAQIAGTGAFVDFAETATLGGLQAVPISGDLQTDTVGRVLPNSLVVVVQPAGGGAGIAGVPVVWSVTAGLGHFSGDTVVTDSLGHAAVVFAFDTVAGGVTVQANAVGGGTAAVFHQTAVAGPPHHLAFTVAPPDTAKSGIALVPQPVVQVRDTFNNPILHAGFVIRGSTNSAFGAPKPKLVKGSGIMFSAFPSGSDSALTDATGTATFSGLAMLGSAGPETYNFQVDSLGLPALTKPFTVIAGAPSTTVLWDGAGQSAMIDSLVAKAPQVMVIDVSGNPVPGVQVIFVAKNGSIATGDTAVTDTAGLAKVGSWRMGHTPGTDTLEAHVVGVPVAVFTATAQPPVPTIFLQLVGTSVVGVGRSAPLAVHLSSPAPLGGIVVSLSSDDPSVVSMDSASVTFNQSDTLHYVTVTGVAVGTAHLVGSGPGYDSDTLTVTGSFNLISLPTTLNVPYGANTSIAVTLGQPAPVGGVVVTLTSSDSTKVQVITPTVNIPQGQSSANGTVFGAALGTATVAATNPNYAPDASTVSTTATLNIVNASQTIYSTIPVTQTLEFRSNGSLIAAPAGGIVADLTARDPSCVSVPATTTITAGLSSTVFTPSYGGSAPTPCQTWVVASYPGVNPDSINMTVNSPPTITEYAEDVGSGLMLNGIYAILQAPLPSAQTVTISSLDTTKVLVAQNVATDTGAPSIGVNEPQGTQYVYYGLRAKEGIVNDSAQVQISATGFVTQTAWVHIRQAGAVLYSEPATTATTFDLPIKVSAATGIPYPNPSSGMESYQPIRPGSPLATSLFTFKVSDTLVAKMLDSAGVADSMRSTTMGVGNYITTQTPNVRWAPAGAGVVTLTVSAPGFITMSGSSQTTTISAPLITEYAQSVGSGLAINGIYTVLQTGLPDTQLVTITSLDTTKLLIAANVTADTGAPAQSFLTPKATQYIYYGLRAKEGIVNDSVQVQVASAGYVTQTAWVYIRRPGIAFYNGAPSVATTFDAPIKVTAAIGIPYPNPASGLQSYQPIRPGGTLSTVVSFRVAPSDTIAALIDSVGTPDTVRTGTIAPNAYTSTPTPQVRWQPVTAGIDTLSVSAPGYLSVGGSTVTTTISAPLITEYQQTLGSGLMQNAIYAVLQSQLPSAGTVTVTSLDTTKLLISADAVADTGAPAQAFNLPQGTQYVYYGLRAKEGIINDSVQVSVAAPGYVTATKWIYIRQPGVLVSGPSTTQTTLADSLNFNVYIGVPYPNPASGMQNYLPVRTGAPQASVKIKVSTPSVGRIAAVGGQVDSVTMLVPAGQYQTPNGLVNGGVAFKALTTGVDTVTASIPGYLTVQAPGTIVTVSTPGISYQEPSVVGAGLQAQGYVILQANRHGGTWVHLTSSNPSIALVSVSDTIVGTATDSVFVPDGQQYAYFWIQGVDSASGTPIMTASANGFVDATGPVTIVTPGISLQNEVGSLSLAAADRPIYAYVGVPYAGNTGLSTYQERRPGFGPLTVTFVTSDSSKVLLADLGGSGGTRTAQISVGKTNTPFSKATGGIVMHPVATGPSTTSVTSPGFAPQTDASGTVTVVP